MIENKNVRAVGETTISNLPAALKMLQTMLVPVDTKDPVTQGVSTERVSLSDILKLFEAIGTLPPVGMPHLWATPNIPVGYLEFNGDSFDMELYPELALVFPSGKLPDWRGRVPKCVPIGGDIGDIEEDSNKAHSHNVAVETHPRGSISTREGEGHHGHTVNAQNLFMGRYGFDSQFDYGSSSAHSEDGNWFPLDYAGEHVHTAEIPEMEHKVNVASDGGPEVRVKSVFVTFITRAR